MDLTLGRIKRRPFDDTEVHELKSRVVDGMQVMGSKSAYLRDDGMQVKVVLKLTAESSCKEQTYEIPGCNNRLTVGAVRCLVDFTLCLLKIFTERGYFLPLLLYERSPAVVNGKCGARRSIRYRADSCRYGAGVLINHIRCSRDRKAVLPYAHGAELKSAVKSSDQGKTCVLPEVSIITVGSVAVYCVQHGHFS